MGWKCVFGVADGGFKAEMQKKNLITEIVNIHSKSRNYSLGLRLTRFHCTHFTHINLTANALISLHYPHTGSRVHLPQAHLYNNPVTPYSKFWELLA